MFLRNVCFDDCKIHLLGMTGRSSPIAHGIFDMGKQEVEHAVIVYTRRGGK